LRLEGFNLQAWPITLSRSFLPQGIFMNPARLHALWLLKRKNRSLQMRKTVIRSSLFTTVAAMTLLGGIGIAAAQHEGAGMGGGPAVAAGSQGGEMNRGREGGQDRRAQSQGRGETQGRGEVGGSGPQNRQGRAGEEGNHAGGHERVGEHADGAPAARVQERGHEQRPGQELNDRNRVERGHEERGRVSDERIDREHGRATGEGRIERDHERAMGSERIDREHGRAVGEERFDREHGRVGEARSEREGRLGRLSSEERTRIHERLFRERSGRVGHLDFDVRRGERVPGGFHDLYALPPDIVSILPEYRDFRYFVYEDEIVIVDPETLEIVAIIPA
jgi:hypothetical protein